MASVFGWLRWWRQPAASLNGSGKAGTASVVSTMAPDAPSIADGGEVHTSVPVPAAWRSFAERVQATFQTTLAGDDQRARRVRAAFRSAGKATGMVVGSVWVTSLGAIRRLDIEGVPTDLSDDMRAVLMSSHFGMAPPPDMPQPLRLRLRLSDDEPGRGQWGR